MLFEQLRAGGCLSYVAGCEKTCAGVIVDPALDLVDRYVALTVEKGLRVRYVIDSHTHADHFSAARELARQLGARIVMHRRSAAPFADMQVGQVAIGAISEADRHNIRGERISVDTIPLVGEQELAAAVRAVVRLPRVRLLVLAGSIMGGEITKAVDEVREKGLIVISLNMAGTLPDAADLVVSDPVQAGVMAVMAIADTAKFNIVRQQKRRY